jgi:hypothetical protein
MQLTNGIMGIFAKTTPRLRTSAIEPEQCNAYRIFIAKKVDVPKVLQVIFG